MKYGFYEGQEHRRSAQELPSRGRRDETGNEGSQSAESLGPGQRVRFADDVEVAGERRGRRNGSRSPPPQYED